MSNQAKGALPTLAEIKADIKQGNPDMSEAQLNRAARQTLDGMMDQAQENFQKRRSEGSDYCGGGKVKKYKSGGKIRGAGRAKKGVRKCKIR